MIPPSLLRTLERLRATGFRDLGGARLAATVPIGERLLNEVIAGSLPPNGAVREATIHPQPDDRVGVRVKLARPGFLPPIRATLVIARQPDLPNAPRVVFRVTGLPPLLTLAGRLLPLESMLPPGVRLEGDLLTVDLAVMLARHGQRELLDYAERLRVTAEAGRLIVHLDAAVPPRVA